MTPADALTKIEAQLAAATPGPWQVTTGAFTPFSIGDKEGRCIVKLDGPVDLPTVRLIIRAPTYLAALVEVAKAATELHHVLGAEANWRDGHPDKCPDSPTETCISCIYEAGNALEASLDALTKAVEG